MRIKKKNPEIERIETREEMENCVREICLLTIRRDDLTAQMNDELARVRDRYQAELAEIQTNLDVEMGRAEQWAMDNWDLFAGKKSISMVHGTIGYRVGMPRLKTLTGWTWDRVLETLRTAFPEYIRMKEEVAKDQIISDREALGPDRMRRMGVKVVQDETFFVEPNKDKPEEGGAAK